jgi:hypothetical protein
MCTGDAVFTNTMAGGEMNNVREPSKAATQFKAELWTTVGETSHNHAGWHGQGNAVRVRAEG